MRIGVDVDEVLYHWEKTARYLLREVLPNSPYTKEGPLGQKSTYWNYIPDNVSKEHWDWLWTEGVKKGMFRNGHLIHGALEGCRGLKRLGHQIIIITHRPALAVNDTLAWLSFQQLDLSEVHIQTSQEPKSSVRPFCDVYIDDKYENCRDLLDNTPARVVALFNHPWNQINCPTIVKESGEKRQDLVRVNSWREFVQMVATL